MIRRPPISTRTDIPFPSTPLFRSDDAGPIAAAATVALLLEEAATRDATAHSGDPSSPWGIADGWRLGHAGQRRLVLRRADTRHDITAHGADGEYRIEHDDSTTVVARSEEHTSELQSLMRISYAVFC